MILNLGRVHCLKRTELRILLELMKNANMILRIRELNGLTRDELLIMRSFLVKTLDSTTPHPDSTTTKSSTVKA